MLTGLWSQEEHNKFLVAIKLYPNGPWRKIAAYIGTRSIRQVQTHAQKYHEKVKRRMRGLHKGRRSSSRKEHRIDDDLLAACKVGEGFGVVLPKHIDASPSLSPQQQPTFGSRELMVPLLLDSTPALSVELCGSKAAVVLGCGVYVYLHLHQTGRKVG
eukprot:jgi/Phyca11/533392/estExt2_fgenesh1_pg.C_PHYCAscaffold_130098